MRRPCVMSSHAVSGVAAGMAHIWRTPASAALLALALAGCGSSSGSTAAGSGSNGGENSTACFAIAGVVGTYNEVLDAGRNGTATASDIAGKMKTIADKMTTVAGYATGSVQTGAQAVALHAGRARVAALSEDAATTISEEGEIKAAFDGIQPSCAGQ